MLESIVLRVRLGLSMVVVVAVSGFALGGGLGSAQAQEDVPCQFDDGTDEWACARTPHVYQMYCEGHDCYSSMEFCCIILE